MHTEFISNLSKMLDSKFPFLNLESENPRIIRLQRRARIIVVESVLLEKEYTKTFGEDVNVKRTSPIRN